MKQKHMQMIALVLIELVLFLPIAMVDALIITHEPNPARDITGTTAAIEWQTDAESTSRVDYGKTKQLGEDVTLAGFDTFHSVGLANLSPNSRYYFQLTSIAATGDYRVDNNNGQFYSFLTLSEGDIIAPAISNVTLMALTSSTATIRWETNEPSDSTVHYGPKDGNLSESKYSAGMVKTHVVTFPASEGIMYDYTVESCDANNNCRESQKQFFRGGSDINPPEINVELPEWHHSSRLDIEGTTEPYSQVRLYIDGSLARMLSSQQTGEEGKITFLNVALPNPENLLKLVSTDQIGNEAELEQMVRIDPAPPTLSVSGLESPTNSPSATLKISASEPVTLIFEVGLIDDILPDKAENLETKQVSETIVDLQWDALDVSDLDGYVVYRMEEGKAWVRIAHATQNTYQDAKVRAGTEYSYKVAGYDKHCNEGEFSDVLVVDVPGEKVAGLAPLEVEEAEIACDMIRERSFDGGETTETVTFEEGLNKVIVTAVDRGGHQVVYRNETLFDMNPPEFLQTNLAEISPTYVPTITVEGQVSEEASILVLVDGESAMLPVPTDAEGYFSFPVDLSRANPATAADISLHLPALSALSGDMPAVTGAPAWTNEVTLIAVDATGSQSVPIDGVSKQVILFTTCGSGSWFRVDIGGTAGSVFGATALTPAALNPRLMLEGSEIISFPIQLNYTGSGNAQIDGVTLSKDPVSKAAEEEYDSDWVTLSTMCNPEKTTCIVQMPVQVPADEMPEGKNMTMYAKELIISNHRCTVDEESKDPACEDSDCLVPGMGCLKIPMTLEITFRIVRNASQGSAQQIHYPGQPIVESKVQKTCWPLEMSIDRRINPDIIPGGLLRGAQGFLNNTINLIDAIYEPLNKIRQYVFYACAFTWVANFFASFAVNTACKSTELKVEKGDSSLAGVGAKILGVVVNSQTGGGTAKVNMDYARLGVCDIEYSSAAQGQVSEKEVAEAAATSGTSQGAMEEANQKCKACEKALKNKESAEKSMKHLCDRIWCPSAPTLQRYIKEKAGKAPKAVPSKAPAAPAASGTSAPAGTTTGKVYYLGSSCSCVLPTSKVTPAGPAPAGTTAQTPAKPIEGQTSSSAAAAMAVAAATGGGASAAGETAGEAAGGAGVAKPGETAWSDKEKDCIPMTSGKTTVSTSFPTIKKVYEMYKQEQKASKERGASTSGGAAALPTPSAGGASETSPSGEKTTEGTLGCSGPHTAKPYCCGAEYMQEWGSACGLPFNDEAWFSEIEQSMCLAGQAANQPSKISGVEKEKNKPSTVDCHRTFNSVAGFCEASGNASGVEPLPLGNLKKPLPPTAPAVDSDDPRVFACIKQPSKEEEAYIVKFCYKTKKDVFDTAVGKDSALGSAANNFFPFRKEWGFYSRPGWDVSDSFKEVGDDAKEQAAMKTFCPKLTGVIAETGNCEDIYNTIKAHVGVPDKPYIVEPTSSLWRTIQCMCLSGLLASLNLWKRVFTALMNCFKTIEETGDGSAGVCQAAVSVYVCDMIYEMIKCFSSRYGKGSGGRQSGASAGSFFGALSSAGTAVADSVSGRYGNSPMWQTMFSENKVMHAICIWAFTGTWDLDLGSMLGGNASLPVTQSIGALYPCERRYKSFNPATTPEGLTTWLYHFGVALIPGADLTYRLKLICESGYECKEAEGFERGACDCRNGEQELYVTTSEITGQLSRTGELNTEVFYQVENTGYRYNKAILEWEYTDNDGNLKKDSVDCKMNQIGAAPGFCNFDIAHMMFRCSLGITTDNWAKLNRVEPNYPGAQPAFKLGDDIEILVDVQQAIPSNPDCASTDCEYTKYLVGTIYNHKGGVVWSNEDNAKRLNTAGQSIITNLPDDLSIPNADSFNNYVGMTTAATAIDPCLRGTHPNVLVDECQPGDSKAICSQRCQNFDITFSGTPTDKEKSFYVYATNISHHGVFKVNDFGKRANFDIAAAKANIGPGTTYYIPAEVQPSDLGPLKENDKTVSEVFSLGNGNLKVTIIGNPKAYAEIAIVVNVPETGAAAPTTTGAAANVCSLYDTFEKAKAKPWKAEYKIYKAKKIGGRYERSNDLEGGEATKSTNFYVVCSQSVAVAGVQLTRNCGDGTQAEIRGCWCDAGVQERAKNYPETTNFDCGPNSTAAKGFVYCVDHKCADKPVCADDVSKGNPNTQNCICTFKAGTAVECAPGMACDKANQQCIEPKCNIAESVPVPSDCTCISTTDSTKQAKCKMEDKLACYGTGECKLPKCPTDKKLDFKCLCNGNPCNEDQVCCEETKACVRDVSLCPTTAGPKITSLKIGGALISPKGNKYVKELNPNQDDVKLIIKANYTGAATFNMEIRPVVVDGNDAKELIGSGFTKQIVVGNQERDLTFDVPSASAGKEYTAKIILADSVDPTIQRNYTLVLNISGKEGKPLLNFDGIYTDQGVKVNDIGGTYFLEYADPFKYKFVFLVNNFGRSDYTIEPKIKQGTSLNALGMPCERIPTKAECTPKFDSNLLNNPFEILVEMFDKENRLEFFSAPITISYIQLVGAPAMTELKVDGQAKAYGDEIQVPRVGLPKEYTVSAKYTFYYPTTADDTYKVEACIWKSESGQLEEPCEVITPSRSGNTYSVSKAITFTDPDRGKERRVFFRVSSKAINSFTYEGETYPYAFVFASPLFKVEQPTGEADELTFETDDIDLPQNFNFLWDTELTVDDINKMEVTKLLGKSSDNRWRFYSGTTPIKGVPTSVIYMIEWNNPRGFVSIAVKNNPASGDIKPLLDQNAFRSIEIENTAHTGDRSLSTDYLRVVGDVDTDCGEVKQYGSVFARFRQVDENEALPTNMRILPSAELKDYGPKDEKWYLGEWSNNNLDYKIPYLEIGKIRVNAYLGKTTDGFRFYTGKNHNQNDVVFRVKESDKKVSIAPHSLDKPLWQMIDTEEFNTMIELDGFPSYKLRIFNDPELGEDVSPPGNTLILFGSGGIGFGGYPTDTILEKFRKAEETAGIAENDRLFPDLYNEINNARYANAKIPIEWDMDDAGHSYGLYDKGLSSDHIAKLRIDKFVAQMTNQAKTEGFRFYFGYDMEENKYFVLRVNMYDVDDDVSIAYDGVDQDGLMVALKLMLTNMQSFQNVDITGVWGNLVGYDLDDYGNNLLQKLRAVEKKSANQGGGGFSDECTLFNNNIGISAGDDISSNGYAACWT